MPAQAWRWNREATMATDVYARSHALRLTVLGTPTSRAVHPISTAPFSMAIRR